jgi:branched-chain amino acid transport system substrate-binding protein
VGDLAEYIFSAIPWVPDLFKVKPWAQKIADDFQKEYNVPFSVNAVNPYATFYVMVDALERAKSRDRERIREALAATNITEGKPMILPMERVKFGPDGQNYDTGMLVTQIQKRSLRIVYPFNLTPSDVKPVWPIPSWDERK